MRAFSEMASGIAHDFNNALTMILGFSELMLAEPDLLEDTAQVRQNLKLVAVAAEDAASIVRRLRELYRERAIDETVEAVDLREIAVTAIALTEPKWRAQAQARGVRLVVRQAIEPECVALASESDLRELLVNLILNAVDASHETGTIAVRARPDRDEVVLEVSDDGQGMTEEVRARCLEPFFTTKGEQGTGLGLPMVYGIVRRHRGTISIESAPGTGTTISVRLPRAGMAAVRSERTGTHHPNGPWRILVVDDEEHVRTVLRGYLTHAGHEVSGAETALDALKSIARQEPDLVLLDRAMPDMSGDRLALLIRDLSPAIRILMVSGFGAMRTAEHELPDVDGFLSKPIRIAELLGAVARVMADGGSADGDRAVGYRRGDDSEG
jgi:CheY-like chemotaxis protein/anti-sigma regulatory factor (Ser/Thr protein kinase)